MSFTQTFGGSVVSPAQPSYADYTSATANLVLSWPLETAPSNNIVAAINDVAFPTTGYTVTMPNASQVSVGIAPLFTNQGTDAYSVLGSTGSTILTATAGSAWYAYLASGGSASGTWRTFQMASLTSSASASALAGYGLVAITTTLNQQYAASSTSVTPTTLAVADRAKLITWTGGAGVFNLTAAATLTNGWFINIYNNGTGALVITPAGGQLINGVATKTMNPGDSFIVVCDGVSAFYTIGFGQSSSFAFDYTSIDVSGSGTYTLSGTQLNRIAYKFTGVITGNQDVIVPSTVQQYWIDNSTTGAFTLGFRTVTQASPGVSIGNASTRAITYCNGTIVVNADTNALSSPIQISQGGTAATTASSARANLDVPQTLEAFTYALIL